MYLRSQNFYFVEKLRIPLLSKGISGFRKLFREGKLSKTYFMTHSKLGKMEINSCQKLTNNI